ncbi:MAG: hypothetical protein IT336_05715 [Thermomicrobiales bacterium]|nr:hypothetical protein [Thermomicrobiales bacterium]
MTKRVILKSRYRDQANRESVVFSDCSIDEDALASAREKAGTARTGIMLMCRNHRARMLQQRGIDAGQLTFAEEWAVEREESTPLEW